MTLVYYPTLNSSEIYRAAYSESPNTDMRRLLPTNYLTTQHANKLSKYRKYAMASEQDDKYRNIRASKSSV